MTSTLNRQIILVEGPIGAGKTSLAMKLAQDLEAKGLDARAFLEFDPDHPIRTAQVDRLLGREPDPKAYGRDAWARLAAQSVVNRGISLLDAVLIQNTLLPAFVAGVPEDQLKDLGHARLTALAPAKPLIVYLSVDDMAQHLTYLHKARPAAWRAENLAWINQTEWARAKGKKDLSALIGFHEAWQAWVKAWLSQSEERCLVLPAQEAEIGTLSQTVLNHAAKPS